MECAYSKVSVWNVSIQRHENRMWVFKSRSVEYKHSRARGSNVHIQRQEYWNVSI